MKRIVKLALDNTLLLSCPFLFSKRSSLFNCLMGACLKSSKIGRSHYLPGMNFISSSDSITGTISFLPRSAQKEHIVKRSLGQ
jgi:hypothetical protein